MKGHRCGPKVLEEVRSVPELERPAPWLTRMWPAYHNQSGKLPFLASDSIDHPTTSVKELCYTYVLTGRIVTEDILHISKPDESFSQS